MSYDSITLGGWLREAALNILPPYTFGFGSSGNAEIQIRLFSGFQALRIVVPWWNTPLKSRDFSLLPGDTREFYAQFETAFAKWKKQQM
jgi:hypothetical protein